MAPWKKFRRVAFTPKGGCPLKLAQPHSTLLAEECRSIHPQGWVPIETVIDLVYQNALAVPVAFTPKGGCPLKPDADGISRALGPE